jgi:hypothetical protein
MFMKVQRRSPSAAAALALSLVAMIAFLPAAASAGKAKPAPAITLAQLAGSWQFALVGNTPCGANSLWFDGTLNSTGQASGTLYNSSGCGLDTQSTQTLTITNLYADGTGSATLSCGSGCSWNLIIQVSPSAEVINVADIYDANNYLAGTAVKQ